MRTHALTILLTAMPILVGPAALCQAPVEEREAFNVLQHRTGWVLLSLVSVETDKLLVDFDGKPYDFEVVGPDPSLPGDTIPKVGDRIRAISTWRLVILDYAKSGEKNRLVSPTTRKQLFPSDKTNLAVRLGTVVEVRDVQLSEAKGSSRILWARVSPWPD
jgi:hypothetical protein